MKHSLLLIFILTAMLVATPGCKRKQPPKPPAQSARPTEAGAQWHTHGEHEAVERKIVIPDEVRNSWKAVRIEVFYKGKNEKKRFDVALDADFIIPDTGITLKAGPFLPDFLMAPKQITSASNLPQNPVVRAQMSEGGRIVFEGWLFAKYPEIHPFTHDKVGVTLIEGIPK